MGVETNGSGSYPLAGLGNGGKPSKSTTKVTYS
jgi:hypothetical protein